MVSTQVKLTETSASKLESLPRELITHIATFVEALSVIRLSLTSKTIRAACWDSLLFKEILTRTQRLDWQHDSLDLEAIARRAGNDVSIWARYAAADDRAWVLAGMHIPLKSRKLSINFLPELAVVKHPIMQLHLWSTATHGPFDYLTSHVYCLTMAVLSATDADIGNFHDPSRCDHCFPKPRENDPAFLDGEGSLWTLYSVATSIRDALKTRRSVWPYNDAANVPFIDFPRAHQVPLQPVSEEYNLPLPFSRSAMELLNTFKRTPSDWDTWYRQHNHALYTSPNFLTSGSWCGYYTHTSTSQQLEPPMKGIRFQREHHVVDEDGDGDAYLISADDCTDGIGSFCVRGAISWDGEVVTVDAHKIYEDSDIWDWDCRLTPFGIVGHWGRRYDGGTRYGGSFDTHGYVWLWKEEWTGCEAGVDG